AAMLYHASGTSFSESRYLVASLMMRPPSVRWLRHHDQTCRPDASEALPRSLSFPGTGSRGDRRDGTAAAPSLDGEETIMGGHARALRIGQRSHTIRRWRLPAPKPRS